MIIAKVERRVAWQDYSRWPIGRGPNGENVYPEAFFTAIAKIERYGNNPYAHFSMGTEHGCEHDRVATHLPAWAKYIKWHLVDERGVPMHYIANARYWLRDIEKYERSNSEWRTPERRRQALYSTIVFGAVESDTDDATGDIMTYNPKQLEIWLNWRLPALQEAFRRDMKELFGDQIEWVAERRSTNGRAT